MAVDTKDKIASEAEARSHLRDWLSSQGRFVEMGSFTLASDQPTYWLFKSDVHSYVVYRSSRMVEDGHEDQAVTI